MTNLDRMYDNVGYQSPVNNQLAQIANLRNLYQSLNNSPNPIAMIQNMAANDPTVRQAVALINQNGNNFQQAAFACARQTGKDVNALYQALLGKR